MQSIWVWSKAADGEAAERREESTWFGLVFWGADILERNLPER